MIPFSFSGFELPEQAFEERPAAARFIGTPIAGLFLGEFDDKDDQEDHHQDADQGRNPPSSAHPATHPSARMIHLKAPLVARD